VSADLLLADARVPAALLEPPPPGDLAEVAIEITAGRVDALHPAGRGQGRERRDLAGGLVFPCFVDCHTHLDKGHIWPRAANPDGTFASALASVQADRQAHWTAADVRARMDFGLRCAFAHGTAAIRTHLDSLPPQDAISWDVFAEVRQAWAGRIALQAVSLVPLDFFADRAAGAALADRVATHGGVLGGVAYIHPELETLLDRVFALATERGLALDFHVDESLVPGAQALAAIARAKLRHRFEHPVLCGHCCSLAVHAPHVRAATLALCAEAGLAVVTLPMCNLYLQDRAPARPATPSLRGVTLVHELAAAGVPVAVASDNCRDPFYAYGDHDVLEVFREFVRIAHADHPIGAWPLAVTATPAAIMGLGDRCGRIGPGRPADLILFRARGWTELLARPQSDRVVLRAGRPIDTTLPDYAELDAVVGGRGA
jgi:cytosine deaminase